MTMDSNTLVDLYRHMEWADATVWKAVMTTEARTDARVRDLFHHLHLVQRAFLGVWRNEEFKNEFPTFDDPVPLMKWGRDYYEVVHTKVASFAQTALGNAMPLPWANMVEEMLGHAPAISTLGDTVLQVTLHSLYHRGQINARLRELGLEPPLVDYIVWIWMGRPTPEWPAST